MMTNVKRKIAAMLSFIMLFSIPAPAMLAEATRSEAAEDERPLVELIVPAAPEKKTVAEAASIEPERIEPERIEPVVTEPERIEPAVTEPERIEPAVTEPERIEPAVTEPERIEPVTPSVTTPTVTTPIAPAPIAPAPIAKGENAGGSSSAPVYSKIQARVTVEGNAITVTITEGSSEAMYIAVGDDFVMGKHKGDSYTFTGLAAGEYGVEVDYEDASNVFRTSVTVEAEENTPPSAGNPGGGTEGGSGGASPITPGSPSGSDPDENGGVSAIVPPSGNPDGEGSSSSGVKQFEIEPILSDGAISVSITGASDWEIEVLLVDKDGKTIASAYRIGSGLAALGKFAAGTYTVTASYVTPTDDASARSAAITVSAEEAGAEENVPQETAKAISAKVSTGSDYIIVSVESASDLPMYVSVGSIEPKSIENGGSVRFSPLVPGKYDIEVDYVNPVSGVAPFRTTAEILDPDVLAKIKITSVNGGENKLSVTGTAEPGKELSLSTTPETATTTVTADAGGQFAAAITCEAGTYTAVSAQYSGNKDSKVTYSGSFTVTAPAAKPTLTVDEINASSTTVSAKTAPGIVVEMKTSDWSQKVTADENGIVRFTLPHTYAKDTTVTFTVYYGQNNAESFSVQVKVAAAPSYGMLKKGDTGAEVKKLIARLKELGYPVATQSTYDDSVVASVRMFQAANGLDVNGTAGPVTQRILYSVNAIPYGGNKSYPTFVRGDRDHPMIYALQQRLKELGYYTIKVDGIFGSGTQRAIRDFQRVNGLTISGKADKSTQRLLHSSAAKPNDGSFSGSYDTLKRSSRYQSAVVPMQRRLKALGYYAGSVDGYFGSQTYRAVRNFQSRNGLSVTGKADAYTQQVLYSSWAKAASGSSSSSSGSSSSTGYRLLYWGCKGSAVRTLQNALVAAGYKDYVRTVDGIFGRWTYDAVRAYQRDHGLAVDGIAGKNTQNSLYGTNY